MKVLPKVILLILLFQYCTQVDKQNTTTKPIINNDIISAKTEPIIQYTTNALLGKVKPSENSSFSKILKKHTTKSNIYLNSEAYTQYINMYNDAAKVSIDLKIVSAFRSFNDQKRIWQSKWTGKRLTNGLNLSKSNYSDEKKAKTILEYSSMPGTSRHHWGTDIDLINLTNTYFEKGKGLKAYTWLQQNAFKYGFYQVYTKKDGARPNGYNEEKWHWTYLPISQVMLKDYLIQINYLNLKGFKGEQTAKSIDVINNYVKGINKQCFISLH